MTTAAKTLAVIVPAIIIVVLSGWLAWALDRARSAEGEVGRQREAASLAAKHFAVAARDAEAMKAESDRLLKDDAALRAELERLRKATRGVKVVTIREGATAPGVATGEPVAVAPGAERCDPCLVPLGATLIARVKSIDATTDKGNLVAIEHLLVERLEPPPPAVIFDGMVTAEGAFVAAPAEAPRARWSLGGGAWWRNPGWTAEVRGGLRVAGPVWVEAAGRFDSQFNLGVRYEIR